MEKNSISVKIYNETYVLRTEADEQEVREIAALVDEKMNLLAEKKLIQSTENVAVWAALDIAAELYRLRRDYAKLLAVAKEK